MLLPPFLKVFVWCFVCSEILPLSLVPPILYSALHLANLQDFTTSVQDTEVKYAQRTGTYCDIPGIL